MRALKRPDYGIDAPGLCRSFLMLGSIAALSSGLALYLMRGLQPWGVWLGILFAVPSAYLLAMSAFMVFESKVTKVAERERLLDLVSWRGDEDVLDVGCGRGLMLVGAARRLTSGKAVGIDIWRSEDQSLNGPEGALENAIREGVSDRVRVQTADMRALPFLEASFDVVLSHWAVHNLEGEADRDIALSEISRVLKPDGVLLLSDIAHRQEYAERLLALGFRDLTILVSSTKDAILKTFTFGSFRPATLLAKKEVS